MIPICWPIYRASLVDMKLLRQTQRNTPTVCVISESKVNPGQLLRITEEQMNVQASDGGLVSVLGDHTHAHAHTHTHTCWFLWFTGTFHRRNGFYTVQAVCAIALHLPYT